VSRYSRRKRRREIRRAREERAIREEHQAIPPCPGCGRRAGQICFVDLSSMRDIPRRRRTTSGCEQCVDGLPGEIRTLGRVHVVRIVDSPSRSEIEEWRRRNLEELDEEARLYDDG
jgi:hypothetical protein